MEDKFSGTPVSAWMEETHLRLDKILAIQRDSTRTILARFEELLGYFDAPGRPGESVTKAETENDAPYPPDWPSQAAGVDRLIGEMGAHAEASHGDVMSRLNRLVDLVRGATTR